MKSRGVLPKTINIRSIIPQSFPVDWLKKGQSSPLDHEAKCPSITSSKHPDSNEILMALQIILVIKCSPFSKEDMRLASPNLEHHPKLLAVRTASVHLNSASKILSFIQQRIEVIFGI